MRTGWVIQEDLNADSLDEAQRFINKRMEELGDNLDEIKVDKVRTNGSYHIFLRYVSKQEGTEED